MRGARADREVRGAEEQSLTRNNFVMDAYAHFRYNVKADAPEWRNGRRGGLKNRCLTTCEFDSRLGHQFIDFARRPFGSPFSFSAKKRPNGVVLVVQMQEMRETILRVRKPQWLLTPAEREDEANPLAPARLATLSTVD